MQYDETRLRIALQKSGKLAAESLQLLQQCGLKVTVNQRQLFARVPPHALPIDILFVRDDDIPRFVSEGVCDMGIVGENVRQEAVLSMGKQSGQPCVVRTRMPLGFSRCRLSLAVPATWEAAEVRRLSGKRIATAYPGLLTRYLKQQGIQAAVVKMEGALEVAPHLQMADAICDIVSTGATLAANGLKEVQTVLESQAMLIASAAPLPEKKAVIAERLCTRIAGVISARDSRYVMLHVAKSQLQAVTDLLPGAEAPTVMPLDNTDKVVVHVVCCEPLLWNNMEALQRAGASAILVIPIEKRLH